MDIKFKEYIPHSPFRKGRLTLEFIGFDEYDPFINCLGRIACKRIPVYAFPPELIDIIRANPEQGYHDSVPFNYDMIRARLKHLPTMRIDPNMSYLHEKHWLNVDYLDKNRDVHKDESDIQFYFHVKNGASENDEDSIVHITTNDIDIFINGEKIENSKLFDKEYPFLLMSLKPKESLEVSMKAVLGIGFSNMIFDSASNYYLNMEDKKGSTYLTVEATSRFDEYTLIGRSFEYFKERIEKLTYEIEKMYSESDVDKKFKILLKNEDHTIAEAMNYELQSHKDIIKSSCTKPNNLINDVYIDVQVFEKKKMLSAIKESMNNLMKKIEKIKEKFDKLTNKSKFETINPSKIKYKKKDKFMKEKLVK